jgi:hypothetical protein
MNWNSIRRILLISMTIALALLFNPFKHQPAIATAPQPPTITPAKLGGKPVYVLYMTRSDDTVLVRCYPGQTPTLAVRDMTGQPGVKEGTLVCKQP